MTNPTNAATVMTGGGFTSHSVFDVKLVMCVQNDWESAHHIFNRHGAVLVATPEQYERLAALIEAACAQPSKD